MSSDTRRNRDRVRTVSFYAALALVSYLLWIVARPFLVPLCSAAILVVCFYPWHRRWEGRLGPGAAALLSTIVVTAILIVPIVLVLIAFVREATAAIGSLQQAITRGQVESVSRWWGWVQQHAPIVGLRVDELLTTSSHAVAGAAASLAGNTLRNVGTLLLDLVLVVFSMFFLFRDARAIMGYIRRVLPFEEEHRERVIRQAHDLIRAGVLASIAVASAQGAAGGLLFWAVGIHGPVFWGVLMAFFSLLPVVGAWIIWLPAAAWLLLTGSVAKGVLVLAIGAGAVSMIDNVLRPALLAGRSEMNGLLVLISLLGGIGAFGLIGIVIGPVIVATMGSLLSAYTTPDAEEDTVAL